MPATVENRYIDFDISLTKNPATKDIYKLTDVDSVKRSVKLLVLTMFGERPFRPWIGSSVYSSLFETADPLTQLTIERSIKDVINNFEPRARLISVDVNFNNIDTNGIEIIISFYVVNIKDPVIVTVNLERVR